MSRGLRDGYLQHLRQIFANVRKQVIDRLEVVLAAQSGVVLSSLRNVVIKTLPGRRLQAARTH